MLLLLITTCLVDQKTDSRCKRDKRISTLVLLLLLDRGGGVAGRDAFLPAGSWRQARSSIKVERTWTGKARPLLETGMRGCRGDTSDGDERA